MMAFALALTTCRTGAEAARTAGYPAGSARAIASKLRRDPRVIAEVKRIRAGKPLPLHAQGVELTPLEFLISVMTDPTADMRVRLRAAVSAAPFVHRRGTPAGKKEQAQGRAAEASKGRFAHGEPPKLSNVTPIRRPMPDGAA